MYGNLNKHKVLSAMLDIVNSNNADFSMKMKSEDIRKRANLEYLPFEKAIFSLALEKYVSFKYEKNVDETGLFHVGANAALTRFFKEKNDRIFWVTLRDTLLVLTSIIIAIATVYALLKDSNSNQQTKNELLKVQQQQAIIKSQLLQIRQEWEKGNYLMPHPKTALHDSTKF